MAVAGPQVDRNRQNAYLEYDYLFRRFQRHFSLVLQKKPQPGAPVEGSIVTDVCTGYQSHSSNATLLCSPVQPFSSAGGAIQAAQS